MKKFRVYNKEINQFEEYFLIYPDGSVSLLNRQGRRLPPLPAENFEIDETNGLTDRRGKVVFFNDIMLVSRAKQNYDIMLAADVMLLGIKPDRLEVIGNLYKNYEQFVHTKKIKGKYNNGVGFLVSGIEGHIPTLTVYAHFQGRHADRTILLEQGVPKNLNHVVMVNYRKLRQQLRNLPNRKPPTEQ